MKNEEYSIVVLKNKAYKKLFIIIILATAFLYKEKIHADIFISQGSILVHSEIATGLPDESYNKTYFATRNKKYNPTATATTNYVATSFSNSMDDTYLFISYPLNASVHQGMLHFNNKISHLDWGAETLISSPFTNKSFLALVVDDGSNNVDFYEFNYTTSTLSASPIATQAIGYPITSIAWSNNTINKLLVTHDGGVHTISFLPLTNTISSFDLISSNPAKTGAWRYDADTFWVDNNSSIERYNTGILSSTFDLTTYDPTFTEIHKIASMPIGHGTTDGIIAGTGNGYIIALQEILLPYFGTRSHRKISNSHTTINTLRCIDTQASWSVFVGGVCTNINDHRIYAYYNINSFDGLDAALTATSQRLSKAGSGGTVPAIYNIENSPFIPSQNRSILIGLDGSTAIPSNSILSPFNGAPTTIPPNTFSPIRILRDVFIPSNQIPAIDVASIILDSFGFGSITDYKNNGLFFGTKDNQLYFRHTNPEDSDWILTGTIAGSLTTTSSADTILHLSLDNKLYLLDTAGKVHMVTTPASTIANIDDATVLTFAQIAQAQTDVPAFSNIGIARGKLFSVAENLEIFKYRNNNDTWVSAGYKPNFSNHLLAVNNTHATHYP